MKRVWILLLALMVYTACGGGGGGGSDDATTTVQPGTVTGFDYGTEVRSTLTDLPTCNGDCEGNLYYVSDIAQFRFCDGSSYQYINLTGPSGSNGVSLVWKGSLATAPASPETNWAYYNSTVHISYIWDGDSWEIISCDGLNGISIIWKGTLSTAPSSPELNWAYYNTTDCKSYIWDGDSWEILAQDGTSGASIVWKGSLPTAPASPQLNWAYYNTTSNASYLWDGDSWEMFAQDGTPGGTLSVSGSISPGSYLALQHNLGRDDLTFMAQFVKNGFIYNWNDYRSIFGPAIIPTYISYYSPPYGVTQLQNGNIVVLDHSASMDGGNFKIVNVEGFTVLEDTATMNMPSITSLDNGNFVVAYTENIMDYPGLFSIYNAEGTLMTDPIQFCSSTNEYTISKLNNGNILIVYQDRGNSCKGTFVIYNQDVDTIIAGPTVFDNDSISNPKVAVQSNGNFVISYCKYLSPNYSGHFIIYNEAGTSTVNGPIQVYSDSSGLMSMRLSITSLNNDNILLAYRDYNNDNKGTFVIYNTTGASIVTPPTVFCNAAVGFYTPTTVLPNGNFIISYSAFSNNVYYNQYVMFDENGNTKLYGPVSFGNTESDARIILYTLLSGNVFIGYRVDTSGYYQIIRPAEPLQLQKVSNNEVRLWNYSNESLDCVISVSQ